MQLSEPQTDALTELINIGYARAAGALSELTGHRIMLEVPQVNVFPIHEVTEILVKKLPGEVASVHQVFSGSVAGNALLVLDHEAALLLNRLLTSNSEPDTTGPGIDASAREVLTEVGNIVLNACLGVFGNLLNVQVTFAVPRLHVESVSSVLNSITVGNEELQYALMIQTKFQVRDSDVSGFLVIILGVTSLDRLIGELEKWEQRQTIE